MNAIRKATVMVIVTVPPGGRSKVMARIKPNKENTIDNTIEDSIISPRLLEKRFAIAAGIVIRAIIKTMPTMFVIMTQVMATIRYRSVFIRLTFIPVSLACVSQRSEVGNRDRAREQ